MSHPCSEGHGRPLFLCPQANLDVLWMEWRTSFLPRAAPLGPEPRTVGSVPRGDPLPWEAPVSGGLLGEVYIQLSAVCRRAS